MWDLYSKECERFYAAWNIAIRICFGVDRTTHRYLISELTTSLHPKVMMCSRYASLHQSLVTSDKFAVRFLARLRQHDHRTVFGKTLARIAQESRSDFPVSKFISRTCVKRNLKYFPIPDEEAWTCPGRPPKNFSDAEKFVWDMHHLQHARFPRLCKRIPKEEAKLCIFTTLNQ